VESGNRLFELCLDRFTLLALQKRSDFFDHGLCSGLVSEVSNPASFALSCPFQGGWVVSQIVISFWEDLMRREFYFLEEQYLFVKKFR
jgi:hypothetical protein